jgi:hypothetical protein
VRYLDSNTRAAAIPFVVACLGVDDVTSTSSPRKADEGKALLAEALAPSDRAHTKPRIAGAHGADVYLAC